MTETRRLAAYFQMTVLAGAVAVMVALIAMWAASPAEAGKSESCKPGKADEKGYETKKLKATGVSCNAAVKVAKEWNATDECQSGGTDSFQCTIGKFQCKSKADYTDPLEYVYKVNCTKGKKKVSFTKLRTRAS